MILTVIYTLIGLFALVAAIVFARVIGRALENEARRYFDSYYK